MGLEPVVVPSGFDEESLDKQRFPTPADYARENSRCKTFHVWRRFSHESSSETAHQQHKQIVPDFIIGSDTIVVLEDRILEKPRDEGEAYEMLQLLSGRRHRVITAVTVVNAQSEESRTFHVETDVEFAQLAPEEIWAYIRTGEPMDKAGAYGIQGYGGALVKRIEGDFFCVMGFPMHTFAKVLAEMLD
jgi:septum formation protein